MLTGDAELVAVLFHDVVVVAAVLVDGDAHAHVVMQHPSMG